MSVPRWNIGKVRHIAVATLLPKFGERELQKCTFNRKEALFTPSDSAPDIIRNGLQVLARHSLQHYTARVRVNRNRAIRAMMLS